MQVIGRFFYGSISHPRKSYPCPIDRHPVPTSESNDITWRELDVARVRGTHFVAWSGMKVLAMKNSVWFKNWRDIEIRLHRFFGVLIQLPTLCATVTLTFSRSNSGVSDSSRGFLILINRILKWNSKNREDNSCWIKAGTGNVICYSYGRIKVKISCWMGRVENGDVAMSFQECLLLLLPAFERLF
jgi:hypothetical protein